MSRIAGIDGCPSGWLRLERELSGGEVVPRVFAIARDLFADADAFAVMTIDVPVALPDAGARVCDQEARRLIQPRGSSVFPAPLRVTLDAASYADACDRSLAAARTALSKQAFAILPKIREVDAILRAQPTLQSRVREIHPEVCFRVWKGSSLVDAKKSGLGFVARYALVESSYPRAFAAVREAVPRREATDDDILDAFAALWTAERIARGTAISIPESPPRGSAGLRMEMPA